MMIPILLCSLIGVTVVIERLFFFYKSGTIPEADQMLTLIQQQKFTDALSVAEQKSSPLLRVLSSGILNRADQPEKAMEAAGLAELTTMKRGMTILDTIITLGPLLGLLGTIIGMIDSFGIMAESGLGQPHAVTGGVAEALVCTAAGIFVAVTTLIPYNYFLTRVEQESERIELYATRVETALATAIKKSPP
ncbi:MAG: MotA/TolQ/ExbB proton channel family protein [Nitrospirales bacterium]|nr:MotA/TolQ/ExbB proton channel family protein [Nitrospirales bacterium]